MAEAYITAGKKVEGVYSRELSLNRLYVVPHVVNSHIQWPKCSAEPIFRAFASHEPERA